MKLSEPFIVDAGFFDDSKDPESFEKWLWIQCRKNRQSLRLWQYERYMSDAACFLYMFLHKESIFFLTALTNACSRHRNHPGLLTTMQMDPTDLV